MAESGEIHFTTPDGETSFRIAGDKAELRAKKLKSLSDKRKFQTDIFQKVMYHIYRVTRQVDYYRVTKVLGDTDYVDIKIRVASSI